MRQDAVTDTFNYMFLGELFSIEAGYPFRAGIKPDPQGDALVVQMRDVDPEQGIAWASLERTRLTGRRRPTWLKAGDVLFLARGNRNFAVLVTEPPAPTVCSPHFFLLRAIPGKTTVTPEYLAWLLNQEPAQAYFKRSAEGTSLGNIRREVLDKTPIPTPPAEVQQLIARLTRLLREEAETQRALAENRRLMEGLLAGGSGGSL